MQPNATIFPPDILHIRLLFFCNISHSCSECAASFESPQSIAAHVKSAHPKRGAAAAVAAVGKFEEEDEEDGGGGDRLFCECCGSRYEDMRALAAHQVH